jgi:hypothetical protein
MKKFGISITFLKPFGPRSLENIRLHAFEDGVSNGFYIISNDLFEVQKGMLFFICRSFI